MLRTDTGNFNRFLTSIGLLLLVGALGIPYFYFQDTETLRIPRAELLELTKTGREALEARQDRLARFEVPVLILSLLLAGGGVIALCLGGKRLKHAQKKEDEAVERRAQRENYEIRQLSVDEVEQRRDEQAREVVERAEDEEEGNEVEAAKRPQGEPDRDLGRARREGEKTPSPNAQPDAEQHRVARQPPPSASVGKLDPGADSRRRFQQMRAEIGRIEERTRQVLDRGNFARFEYLSEVKIIADISGRRQISVDGLFESKVSQQPDVAMELKVARAPAKTLGNRVRMYTDELLALLARYRTFTGQEALGWLLIVLPDALDDDSASHQQVRERFNDMLVGAGKCTIIREQDLDQLPALFKETFGD